MKKAMIRSWMHAGTALSALASLSACGDSGGGVASTPTPPVAVAPTPPPPPPPPTPTATNYNTTEYQRSNAAVQANAISAYNAGATGAGIVAAVVDSGVDPNNSQFAGRISPASADVAGSRGMGDDDGHGTAVSDVLLGARDNAGTLGIAFNAILLAARSDTPGTCADMTPVTGGCSHDDNDIARGVDLAVANNARVINISLGGSPANSILRAAIDRATTAGIVIVISAGNDGVTDPAAAVNPDLLPQIANETIAHNLVIIAGALDASNTALAGFSNKAGNSAAHYIGALGDNVHIVDTAGKAFLWSGTSFSAPVVSGAVVLLAQAFPNLTGAQIVDLLFRTAVDIGTPGVDTTYGHGAIDIARAFAPQGQASLAASSVAVSLTNNGTLSAPMGDATQGGLSTIIQDSYGRAFTLDLGQAISHAPRSLKLGGALEIGTQARSISSGATAFALSVAQPRDDGAINRLLLSAHDQRNARAIAGSIITKIGRDTRIALGISTSGTALANQFDALGRDNFIAGTAASASLGFETRAKSAFALRHSLGMVDFTANAETGEALLWQPRAGDVARAGYRGYGYGQFSLGAARSFGTLNLKIRATTLTENETVLGAHFDGLFAAGGARSWFADTDARWMPIRNWTLDLALRRGWTRVSASGVRQGNDLLKTSAWSLDIARARLFSRTDRLAVRIAQPLRVTSGGFDLTLPTGYDYVSQTAQYGTQHFNLAPQGREIDVETVYSRPMAGGFVAGNFYYRTEPGNFARSADDLGMAIRFTLGL